MLRSSGPGKVFGPQVANRVFAIRLVQWLGWVFETQTNKQTKTQNNRSNGKYTNTTVKQFHAILIPSSCMCCSYMLRVSGCVFCLFLFCLYICICVSLLYGQVSAPATLPPCYLLWRFPNFVCSFRDWLMLLLLQGFVRNSLLCWKLYVLESFL